MSCIIDKNSSETQIQLEMKCRRLSEEAYKLIHGKPVPGGLLEAEMRCAEFETSNTLLIADLMQCLQYMAPEHIKKVEIALRKAQTGEGKQ